MSFAPWELDPLPAFGGDRFRLCLSLLSNQTVEQSDGETAFQAIDVQLAVLQVVPAKLLGDALQVQRPG